MGRTNPTYRRAVRQLRRDWQDFRRALRHADRQHVDAVFDAAADYADAAGHHNPDDPMTAVLLSVAVAQERRITALEQRLEDRG